MRFPRLLLIRLCLWREPADLPIVATLVAWPKRTFLVLAVAWLSGYVNAWEYPRPPKLLFARFTAAGDTTQCRIIDAKVRIRADVVVCA